MFVIRNKEMIVKGQKLRERRGSGSRKVMENNIVSIEEEKVMRFGRFRMSGLF